MICDGRATTLFVTHSLEQIRELCDRVLWLEQGNMKVISRAQAVCDAYQTGQVEK